MTDCSKHNKASSGAAIAGVSRSGQVSTASLSGTAVVLVTVHEEFGINQTAVVHVEVGMWKQCRSGHEKLAATRITLCKRSRFLLLCDALRGKAAATTTEFCCCNRLHEVKLLWFHAIRFLTNISRFIQDKLSLWLFSSTCGSDCFWETKLAEGFFFVLSRHDSATCVSQALSKRILLKALSPDERCFFLVEIELLCLNVLSPIFFRSRLFHQSL